ncbi:ABC transporter permease [Saccharopolyspora pogona]|uniref:ABC transporter permease n=1 Tax=Saccharopolyspora pogona TaxID=333966 RepID=UPI001685C918|nr:ABC transporter permease [Saccharopolyspora pogona]
MADTLSPAKQIGPPTGPRQPFAAALRATPVPVLIAAGFAVLLLAIVLVPGVFARYGPTISHISDALQPPSAEYWFGTDRLGRDIFARVIHGARYSLLIGLGAMAISLLGGLLLGLLSALSGRVVDEVVTRALDALAAYPTILFALLVVTFTGPGTLNIAIAVGLSNIPRFGRIIRSDALVVRNADFARHSVMFGWRRFDVVLRHILPNVLRTIPVLATLDMGLSIMASSGLSFLGLGPKAPIPEWGVMLAESRDVLHIAWWAGVFPGLTLTLAVIAFTVIGRHAQHRMGGMS